MSYLNPGYSAQTASGRVRYNIHEALEQNIQGGKSSEHFHLTQLQLADVLNIPNITNSASSIYEPAMVAHDYLTVAGGDIVTLSTRVGGSSGGVAIIPAAPASSLSVSIPYTAGAVISGHKVVRSSFSDKIIHADKNILLDATNVLGISSNAAAANDPVSVVISGRMSEPTWNWVSNSPIYLGNDGTLTQTFPTTGFILVVGSATSPTSMLVNIKQAIVF